MLGISILLTDHPNSTAWSWGLRPGTWDFKNRAKCWSAVFKCWQPSYFIVIFCIFENVEAGNRGERRDSRFNVTASRSGYPLNLFSFFYILYSILYSWIFRAVSDRHCANGYREEVANRFRIGRPTLCQRAQGGSAESIRFGLSCRRRRTAHVSAHHNCYLLFVICYLKFPGG